MGGESLRRDRLGYRRRLGLFCGRCGVCGGGSCGSYHSRGGVSPRGPGSLTGLGLLKHRSEVENGGRGDRTGSWSDSQGRTDGWIKISQDCLGQEDGVTKNWFEST